MDLIQMKKNSQLTKHPSKVVTCRETRALPVACLFQRVCFQVLPEDVDSSSLLVVAGVGAAGTGPWAPRHSLAAGAPRGAAAG